MNGALLLILSESEPWRSLGGGPRARWAWRVVGMSGENVLGACAGLTVPGVVLLSVLQQRPPGPFAVREDQTGGAAGIVVDHG
ncbi:hypothetical protein A4U61_08710 [Streptomyces sp. H-KF8]|nr:hypothetical protein A4U61_08710 [Streptomyces sp. H-KF8]